METTERIKVYINVRDGKTICICHAGHKRCDKPCSRDVVERDKFDGWKKTMQRDSFGK